MNIKDFAKLIDYSFMDELNADPDAKPHGDEHSPRQVFSGHYVPVSPTPITDPQYIAHSKTLFADIGIDESLAGSEAFKQIFSGNLTEVEAPIRKYGWATGYALSIFGTEYYDQCPFKTGNGYGDGRAISIFEIVNNNRRWEMQLKGAGPTPYCRGADGRAVLRSSVREFLAQEHMHALGVPTSRSLCLYVSSSDKVKRPWYSEGSMSRDPDILIDNPVAITTRVAPSFIRVGQIELFGRRARKNEHPAALQELEKIVMHLIQREYADEINPDLSIHEQCLLLAAEFAKRLAKLVSNWMRVGYCQGNFNSDNCAAGGFTLDYGPFGFIEKFDPYFQPWTGGGEHFSFWNQPLAAQHNFNSFVEAIRPLLINNNAANIELDNIKNSFADSMQQSLEKMWSEKIGMPYFDVDLVGRLLGLMVKSSADYSMFFRQLSDIPADIKDLTNSFYKPLDPMLTQDWTDWLEKWHASLNQTGQHQDDIVASMKSINPRYSLREWLLAPAYQQATLGDYSSLRELQQVMIEPYAEQKHHEAKYFRLKPAEVNDIGGISHMSCSS